MAVSTSHLVPARRERLNPPGRKIVFGIWTGSGFCRIKTYNKFPPPGADLPNVFDIVVSPPVAGQSDVADLGVQREELQTHGAAESERDLRRLALLDLWIGRSFTLITHINIFPFSSSLSSGQTKHLKLGPS